MPPDPLAYDSSHVRYKPPTAERAPQSLCKPRNRNFSSVRVRCGAELTVPERYISLQKLNICDLLTPLVTPANRLKMQEMAVLEGPDFRVNMLPQKVIRRFSTPFFAKHCRIVQ